jgi:hypothetical protein
VSLINQLVFCTRGYILCARGRCRSTQKKRRTERETNGKYVSGRGKGIFSRRLVLDVVVINLGGSVLFCFSILLKGAELIIQRDLEVPVHLYERS